MFMIKMEDQILTETETWKDARRIAQDVSTRFGNAGESIYIYSTGILVAEYINGCLTNASLHQG